MLEELCKQTNTNSNDWNELDFIPTGVGIERVFENNNTKDQYYVCDDQGYISISKLEMY